MAPAGRAFPDGYLWGTATAVHQVESANWNNDWCLGVHLGSGCAEPSGDACDHWLPGRPVPARERDPDRRRRVNEVFVDAHAKAAAAIREATGVPVGLTLAMSDDQAAPGGEAALAAHHRDCEDPYLETAPGVTTSSGCSPTPAAASVPGDAGPRAGGVSLTTMGYEVCPQALGPIIRHAAAATGVGVLVTENGIATNDDTQRMPSSARRWRACWTVWPRRGSARLLPLEPAGQRRVGAWLPAHLRTDDLRVRVTALARTAGWTA
jgi:hypothetical protein